MAPASETTCRLDVEGLVREHERERDATSTGDMDALMARHFGPPREEAEAERTARGLKEVEALSTAGWPHGAERASDVAGRLGDENPAVLSLVEF